MNFNNRFCWHNPFICVFPVKSDEKKTHCQHVQNTYMLLKIKSSTVMTDDITNNNSTIYSCVNLKFLNTEMTTEVDGNQETALGQAQNVAELNQLMRFQSPSDIWIFSGQTVKKNLMLYGMNVDIVYICISFKIDNFFLATVNKYSVSWLLLIFIFLQIH